MLLIYRMLRKADIDEKGRLFSMFAVKLVFVFGERKYHPARIFVVEFRCQVMCPEICINENSKNPRQEETKMEELRLSQRNTHSQSSFCKHSLFV
ncbi:hypothetical protein TNIN_345671 [Trichonephila inaurata madagascariensis]|uniref:Uncharacterized protein n=1 Tax=Trichonephila inaurata madagascariensis TaxID=2747483 RepID=A0A8X6J4W8_9ARAC|nr:hypothetical protein TNIN_345671 [Trichonephila inaurata madagascariensis]